MSPCDVTLCQTAVPMIIVMRVDVRSFYIILRFTVGSTVRSGRKKVHQSMALATGDN